MSKINPNVGEVRATSKITDAVASTGEGIQALKALEPKASGVLNQNPGFALLADAIRGVLNV